MLTYVYKQTCLTNVNENTLSWCRTESQSACRYSTKASSSIKEQVCFCVSSQHTHRPCSTCNAQTVREERSGEERAEETKKIKEGSLRGIWGTIWPSVHSDRTAWSQPGWESHTRQTAAWTTTPARNTFVAYSLLAHANKPKRFPDTWRSDIPPAWRVSSKILLLLFQRPRPTRECGNNCDFISFTGCVPDKIEMVLLPRCQTHFNEKIPVGSRFPLFLQC